MKTLLRILLLVPFCLIAVLLAAGLKMFKGDGFWQTVRELVTAYWTGEPQS